VAKIDRWHSRPGCVGKRCYGRKKAQATKKSFLTVSGVRSKNHSVILSKPERRTWGGRSEDASKNPRDVSSRNNVKEAFSPRSLVQIVISTISTQKAFDDTVLKQR
jgi:hypothetical protein